MTLYLSQIRDQETAISTLQRALRSDKLHHAYLFEGPPGVGKQLTAMALSAAMNCVQSPEACGECSHCRKIRTGNHPDVKILQPPEGKRNILIEGVRQAEEWIRMRPHEGKAKVLIISPADAMTESAANALLKTLEEPRPGNYIILVTAAASSLLPTVRSRCQTVRFKALSSSTIAELLLASGVSEEEAALLVSLSCGSMETALQYRSEELSGRIDIVAALIEGASSRIPEQALSAAARLRDRGEAIAVLELLLFVMEDLLNARAGVSVSNGLSLKFGDLMTKLQRGGSVESVATHIAAINRALVSIQRNNMNPQLAIEGMVMNMRSRTKNEYWSRIGAK
ncbi:MAG: DNA polymerase III subunit delta' [Deltaproteobacteria bacterium]|nr:DNA polymerase III subunit delta' [Deltaproteobacteria bacterium]MBN2673718.1 DNA polymerase III subunit delta' [Deltaproteobacteria bacterium]